MSNVQLILKPQIYTGYSLQGGTYVYNQYVADPLLVGGIGTNSTYLTAPEDLTALLSVTTNWNSFCNSLGTAPTWQFNVATFWSSAPANYTDTGIYQLLTGLVVGNSYEVKITISRAAVNAGSQIWIGGGWITGGQYQFTGQTLGSVPATSTGVQSYTFTALSTEEILILRYINPNQSVADYVSISEVKVKDTVGTLTGGQLYDGQVVCDLYEDEEVPLTLSVENFLNTAEKTQSYSKAFKLPATKRNNKIFNNLFEVTRATTGADFNPHLKTQATLKENGFTIFEGFLRLLDVSEKDGETSYNVNLYTDVTGLIEVLKERTIADLTNVFDELDHDYTRTNVQASWSGSLSLNSGLPPGSFAGATGVTTTDVLKYPFVNWTGNLNRVPTLSQSANGATASMPTINNLSDAFRPWLKLKYIIQNIFFEAGFEYSSNFFDSTDFGKLYMDCNWGDSIAPRIFNLQGWCKREYTNQSLSTGSWNTLLFDNNTALVNPDFGYNSGTGTFTAVTDGQTYTFTSSQGGMNLITALAVPSNKKYFRIKRTFSSGATTQYPFQLTEPTVGSNNIPWNFSVNFSITIDAGDTLSFEAFSADTNFLFYGPNPSSTMTVLTSAANTAGGGLLGALRGDLSQWDFLKGIFTMFNLIAYQDSQTPTTINIEPYKDLYTARDFVDWTDKVDAEQIVLKPLDLKAKVVLQYEEDDSDYAFSVYKQSTQGYLYGSQVLDNSTAPVGASSLLIGKEEIIASPFAATVIKPEFDDFLDLKIPVIYGSSGQFQHSAIENLPRILYDCGTTNFTGQSYFVPAANGVSGANLTGYLSFSHTTDVPSLLTSNDYNFGQCQLLIGSSPTDNLYQIYYSPYFNQLYHPDTRKMNLKVLLTEVDITNFDFFTPVFIKNRVYRVNKISYNPKQLSNVEFILLG